MLGGVFQRKSTLNGQEFFQLVLPPGYQDIVFEAFYDDLGYQGRDRTNLLIRQRFFLAWNGQVHSGQSHGLWKVRQKKEERPKKRSLSTLNPLIQWRSCDLTTSRLKRLKQELSASPS